MKRINAFLIALVIIGLIALYFYNKPNLKKYNDIQMCNNYGHQEYCR